MHHLETVIADKTFIGKSLSSGGKSYTVAKADNFSYTDPIDGSVAKNQVIRVKSFVCVSLRNILGS